MIAESRHCGFCGEAMTVGRYKRSGRKRFCSKKCRGAARSQASKQVRTCPQCGEFMNLTTRADAIHCSDRCRVNAWRQGRLEQTRVRGRVYRMRRRAHEVGGVVEVIDRAAIFGRDAGRCYLCGGECSPGEYELDHVIPLSRGGPTVAANLRVTHIGCNRRKGVRSVDEMQLITLT